MIISENYHRSLATKNAKIVGNRERLVHRELLRVKRSETPRLRLGYFSRRKVDRPKEDAPPRRSPRQSGRLLNAYKRDVDVDTEHSRAVSEIAERQVPGHLHTRLTHHSADPRRR